MLLYLKKKKDTKQNKTKKAKTKTNKQNKTKKNKTIKATTTTNNNKKNKNNNKYNSPCLHHRWKCYQAIALNDQQVGPTSLVLLSP